MDLGSIISTTEISMKECGKKTKDTVKASTTIKMGKSIEVSIDRVKEKVLEHSTIKTEIDMKANGKTGI